MEGDRGSTRLAVMQEELGLNQTSTVIASITLEVPARRAMPPNNMHDMNKLWQ